MINQIRSFFKQKNFPILFTLTVLIAYGIPVFLGWFSFYGDDWIYIYNYHLMGSASFPAFVAWDRPFSAWIYTFSTALFGESVLPYHLLLLAERWISVFLFWQILKKVWPAADRITSGAVLLFACYPGFHQQPIAVQFILHFASLDLCLFSILCMLHPFMPGMTKNKPFWILAGFASGTLALFSCEYFVGLEAIRPALLWFTAINYAGFFPQKNGARAWLCLKSWAPYLLSLAIFLVWRVFIFSFQTYQPKLLEKLSENPISALKELAGKIAGDLITVFVTAWRKTLNQPEGSENRIFFVSIVLALFILCVWFLSRIQNSRETGSSVGSLAGTDRQILITGIIAMLTAGIPFWTTFIHVEIPFPWDRSTISFSAGVALTAAALIAMTFKSLPQILAVSSLTALAVGSHYTNAVIYKNEALKMNDYFWQLAWRAPGLEPGTILISDNIPLDRYSDSDLTPVVNWQYAPQLTGSSYQYKVFDLTMRAESFFSDPQPGQDIMHDYRNHTFQSTMDKVLAVFYKKNSCLWVITETERDYPGLPESIFRLADLSNPDMILTNPNSIAVPPAPIGSEPDHDFCFYFQKTNLELQRNDPAGALVFATRAVQLGLEAYDPVDWIPLAKTFILNQKWDQANLIAEKINGDDERSKFFCSQLSTLDMDNTQPEFAAILQNAGCDR